LIVSLTKRPLAVLAALVVALALALGTLASSASAQGQGDNVVLCHATGSEQNPFEVIVTDNQAVIEAHDPEQGGHEDDFILGLRTDFPADTTEEEFEALCAEGPPTTEPPPDDGNGPPPDDGNGVTPPVVDQYDDDDGDVTIIIIKTADGDVVKVPGGKFFFKGGQKFVKAPSGKVFKVAKVVHVKKATATATATATAKTVTATATAKTVTATPTAKTVTAKAVKAQYVQYKAAKAQYVQYKAAPTALPPTGGSGPVVPVAIGALLLVLGSGIMVLKMARSTS
jgi:hypothetical protein